MWVPPSPDVPFRLTHLRFYECECNTQSSSIEASTRDCHSDRPNHGRSRHTSKNHGTGDSAGWTVETCNSTIDRLCCLPPVRGMGHPMHSREDCKATRVVFTAYTESV